jgi:hypothetical protein
MACTVRGRPGPRCCPYGDRPRGRYTHVSKRVQTGLLAAAALASIAVAGVRIAGAAGHEPGGLGMQIRAYGTTPALAAAALAKLHTPSGFRPSRCIGHEPDSMCFSRSRSTPLDHATMRRLVASFGVRSYSVFGVDPIECFRTKHFKKPRLTLQACHVEVHVGDERLVLYASSLVVSGPDWVRGTTRTAPELPHPSEVMADVIGHFLHNGSRDGGAVGQPTASASL